MTKRRSQAPLNRPDSPQARAEARCVGAGDAETGRFGGADRDARTPLQTKKRSKNEAAPAGAGFSENLIFRGILVDEGGFEPPASSLRTSRSTSRSTDPRTATKIL